MCIRDRFKLLHRRLLPKFIIPLRNDDGTRSGCYRRAPSRMLSRTRTIIYEETLTNSTLQTFREAGAYLNGHFRLTSGLHSSEYLQSALVLQHPVLAERLGRNLAESMPKGQVVASPALGGLIIGHEVARAMG